MKDNILRLNELTKRCGLSRPTIYRLIKRGEFPKQIKLTNKSSGWSSEEIDNWISEKLGQRDNERQVKNDCGGSEVC
ncbi:helix-turn-helix transcriptional regulator [Cysteiniphilum sp. 6C5]|uniref:helix-turn-helix transcriptional regulator n=1 Tax=unclassified Cysteiniphilum TaxID=2610889 RepID=UPI003F83F6AA